MFSNSYSLLLQLLHSNCNIFTYSDIGIMNLVTPLTIASSGDTLQKSVSDSGGLFSNEGIPYWILFVSVASLVVSFFALYISIKNNKEDEKLPDVNRGGVLNTLNNVIQYCNNNSKTVSELKKRIAQLESQLSNQNLCSDKENRVVRSHKGKKEASPKPTPILEEPKEYIWLKVIDGGKLTLAQGQDNAVYRAWNRNGTMFFEFSCLRTIKAINNRTSLIEPFCEIHTDSIHPDQAKEVLIKQCGKLSADYSVISKVIIQYI